MVVMMPVDEQFDQNCICVCVCVFVQIEEQVNLLQKGITHIGVGTPGRISALIEKGRSQHNGLCLNFKFLKSS